MSHLDSLIEQFLEDRREYDRDQFFLRKGPWPPVEREDLHQLAEIINELIKLKWECDDDGDLPIQFDLLDRNKYQVSHYFKVPKWFDLETKEEMWPSLYAANTNVAIAQEELDRVVKVMQMLDHDEKEAAKANEDA